jgi:hypothetical protein
VAATIEEITAQLAAGNEVKFTGFDKILDGCPAGPGGAQPADRRVNSDRCENGGEVQSRS